MGGYLPLVIAIILLAVGGYLGWRWLKELEANLRAEVQRERELAQKESATLREQVQAESKSLLIEAQRQVENYRSQAEKDFAEKSQQLAAQLNAARAEQEAVLARERTALETARAEVRRLEERLTRRGEQLDSRAARLDALEEKLRQQSEALAIREEVVSQGEEAIAKRLEAVAELSREVAREQILALVDAGLAEEKAEKIRAAYDQVAREAKKRAQLVIAEAIQRQAAETSAALAVSVVPLPNDAMKGRLIGREGRNIRAFESLSGVDLIIDDTPEAVILSSFNPVRRAIAQAALEQLVADGRIHPTRIEEALAKAQEDMKQFLYERGEEASLEAGVAGLKPGLIQLLGRLHFRSSYGQNVLKHSVQVALLSGIMASELGLDVAIAKRSALLHDIGKSVDREVEGSHIEIGLALARRFGEGAEVLDAIGHHHDPENAETIYAVLASAADAISAARPGARRESLEDYLGRLEQLEQIALSFPGVDQAFAIQAGREIRVIVRPERIDEAHATLLAHEIAGRIERDTQHPGQVQVTVVRETRTVAHAR